MIMSSRITIVYHSEYGHTGSVAQAIFNGAESTGANVAIINVNNLSDVDWKTLDDSDAIIFGAPTYMGGVSAEFKSFIDKAGKKWLTQKWKDKIAAGFTNSGSYSGDKLSALMQLSINAAQHGMVWVGQAEMPPSDKDPEGAKATDLNRLGSFLGLMTQSSNTKISEESGDMETARLFGKRVAEITDRFRK